MNERLIAIGNKEQELKEIGYPLTANNFGNMLSGGMRFDLFYNPAPTFLKIKQQVLELHGEKDVQVFSDNSDAIMKLLKQQNRNPLTQRNLYPSTNHLLQQCKNCTVDEYQQIEETVSPIVANDVIKWLEKVVY